MNLSFYRDSVRRHGALPTLCHAAYRVANHVGQLAVWNAWVVTPEKVDPTYLRDSRRGQGRMLGAAAMRPHVKNRESLLTDAFSDNAVANGDLCYASFDGDALTSYAWYTTRPARLTEIDDSLTLFFDPSYAYMYNAYTLPSYRGQRLHAVGMAAAVDVLAKKGLQGVVTYVAATNFVAAKSCSRTGYEPFGQVIVLRVGRQYICRSSAGCKKYRFHVVQGVS